MEILGLEKLSLVDFEGYMCATIFTGGCNFLCPFCHNSGIVKNEYRPIDKAQVFEYLESRKGLLDAVTISGGEPTIHPELVDFIKRIKDMGYLVKLDTNGTNPAMLSELIEKHLIDYVAMDIKNNFNDYYLIVGTNNVPLENIKKSLEILKTSGIDYELRTTLVAEYHFEDNIKKMANELSGAKQLYLQKFVDSGTLIGEGMMMNPVIKEVAEDYKNILSSTIESVELRGY